MLCPHCGERIQSTDHQYCQACGATLVPPAPAVRRHEHSRNVVAASSRSRAMDLTSPGARIVLYGSLAVAAAIALVAVVMAIVLVLTAVAEVMPLLVFCVVVYAISRRQRRRRWVRY